MMTQEEKNTYFWQQFDGLVLAENLPQEYIEFDTRIYCANEECLKRKECVLYARYITECKVFGRTIARVCISAAKGERRNMWDVYYPQPHYGLASFGMCPQAKGAQGCKHYIPRFETK